MALSEEERRLLAELERNFYASEADEVQASAALPRLSKRNLVLGVVLCAVGAMLLVGGVLVQQPLLGLLGFAVAVAGVVLGLRQVPGEQAAAAAEVGADRPERAAQKTQPLQQRLEQRWQQRRDGLL